jgi:hypothetical protein
VKLLDEAIPKVLDEPIPKYPLVNVYITMENHHFYWVNPLQMGIFNSYVSLAEGTQIYAHSPGPVL